MNHGSVLHCAVCEERFEVYPPHFTVEYPFLVCQECDSEAVTADGEEPKHGNEYVGRDAVIEKDGKKVHRMDLDIGDNPVFIDSKKCWRLYKFGGWVTLRDPWECDSIDEFFDCLSE